MHSSPDNAGPASPTASRPDNAGPARQPGISLIIPVLDEELGIQACLERALAQPGIAECIVVDGGSRDRTLEIARSFPVRVLSGPRGRGLQLDMGAAQARGQVLLFLHADVVLPDNAAAAITRTLADPDVVAGAFRTWTVPSHTLLETGVDPAKPARAIRDETAGPGRKRRLRMPLGPLLHLADFRSRYSRLPYGDQAMFVRAEVFHAAGGFPHLPLMEDLALSRRLWSFGTVRIARERVRVSGRRFESAPLKQTFWVNVFPFLHAAGVATETLARLYGAPR